jgi:hypothetical protein
VGFLSLKTSKVGIYVLGVIFVFGKIFQKNKQGLIYVFGVIFISRHLLIHFEEISEGLEGISWGLEGFIRFYKVLEGFRRA